MPGPNDGLCSSLSINFQSLQTFTQMPSFLLFIGSPLNSGLREIGHKLDSFPGLYFQVLAGVI